MHIRWKLVLTHPWSSVSQEAPGAVSSGTPGGRGGSLLVDLEGPQRAGCLALPLALEQCLVTSVRPFRLQPPWAPHIPSTSQEQPPEQLIVSLELGTFQATALSLSGGLLSLGPSACDCCGLPSWPWLCGALDLLAGWPAG